MSQELDNFNSAIAAYQTAQINLTSAIANLNLVTATPVASVADAIAANTAVTAVELARVTLAATLNSLNSAITAVINAGATPDAIIAQAAAAGVAITNEQITNEVPQVCDAADQFQGFRFYDGSSFGYVRLFADRVELLVDQPYSFALDGTVPHNFRVTGKGRDVKLYVDGALAIDGTANFTRQTSAKAVEFGDIAGRNQNVFSSWDAIKYSTTGAFPPSSTVDYVLEEVASFPGTSVGTMQEYSDSLYVSVDPTDDAESSKIYRFKKGVDAENRSVLALTQSTVSAVVVDPNRNGNLFGTTGKYIATPSGLQYVLGSKPFPLDQASGFDVEPTLQGWRLEQNCTADRHSLAGGSLTIDTTAETGERFWKYTQRAPQDAWVTKASNSTGWTVEAVVKIANDGTGGTIDGRSFGLLNDSQSCLPQDSRTVDPSVAPPDTLDAPSLLIDDGTYEEVVQFFQKGIGLKYAGVFAAQDMTDQFYSVRVIGRNTSIAVYVKGDSDKSFRRVIFAPDGLSVKTQPIGDQELPDIAVDDLGFAHAVWQDSRGGTFQIYHAQTGPSQALGKGTISSPGLLPSNNMIFARTAFGLPAAGSVNLKGLDKRALVSGSAAFVSWGVLPGDFLLVYNQEDANGGPIGSPKRYAVSSVANESVVVLDTDEDLSTAFAFASFVVSRGADRWLPPTLVSSEGFESSNPSLIKHSSGELYVAYQNDSTGEPQVYVRRGEFDPFATTWHETVMVTNASNGARFPQLAEVASHELIVAWEDSSASPDGSQIAAAIVSVEAFGAGQSIISMQVMTPASAHARNPRLAINGSRVVVAYEDDVATPGSFDVYSYEADALALVGGTTTRQSSSGLASHPSICAAHGSAFVVYQDSVSGSSQIYAATGSAPAGGHFAWAAPIRITNSRGSAELPDVSCDSNGNAFVAFQDDRTRQGYQDLYLCRFDVGSQQWLSSGQAGLDVKVESYVTYSRRPRMARDAQNNLAIAFEATKDGSRNRIAYTVYDGALITIDDTVSAYFPLDDDGPDAVVMNKIRAYRGSTVPPLEIVLAIDTSSAMSQNGNLDSVKQAASYVVSQLQGTDLFNVMSFADIQSSTVQSFSASLAAGTSANQAAAQTFITNVSISNAGAGQPPGGVIGALGSNFDGPQKLKIIVLFSAGDPAASNAQVDSFRKIVAGANTDDVHIFAFTAGPSNVQMLTALATDSGGQFFQADNSVDLSSQVSDFYQLITSSDFVSQIFDFAADKPSNGTATKATNALHVAAPDPGIAMYDPALQAAFDLRTAGNAFSVPADLFHPTGAIDLWMKPAFASTDATTRAIFGSASPTDTTTKDSISCGLVGGSMKLRIIDSNGALHEASAVGSAFSWAANDLVHLRAVWDENSIGIAALNQASFPSASTGYAVSNAGHVFKTTNGGDSWSIRKTGVSYELYSIDFPVDATTGYACGELGTVIKTTDSGATWQVIDTGLAGDLNAIFFKNNLVGYAAGTGGTIIRTTDGGFSWANVSPASALSDFTDIGIAYVGMTQAVVAVGANAQVYRWVDDNTDNVTFAPVSTPATQGLNGISRVHQTVGAAFIVGDANTIMKSTDGGATWSALTISFQFKFQPQLRAVTVDPSASYVYVVGQNGTFAASKDGGATWSPCVTGMKNGSWNFVDANFNGAGTGLKVIAAGSGGSVMISDNGGAIQRYTVTRSGNLTLVLNGKELEQARVGDQPFTWDPTARDVFFGDFDANGTASANAIFDEVIVYLRPPPSTGAIYRRKEMWTYQSDSPLLVQGPDMEKRLEFGNISTTIKSKSFWESINLYLCGAKEPLQTFGWNAQLGEVDDVVSDLALDQGQRLWMATQNGICSFDTSSASQDIQDWLDGVPLTTGPRGRFVNYTNLPAGLARDAISCITVDSNDNVWAGCGGGVMLLNRQMSSFSAAIADPVGSLGAPGLDAAGSGEVLNAPSAQFNLFTVVQGLPSNNILSIKAFGTSIFVGTDNGMAIISPSGVDPFNTTTSHPGMGAGASSSGQSASDAGQVATDASGASGQDSNSAASQPTFAPTFDIKVFGVLNGLPSNIVRAFAQESKSGQFWVGTDKGVARLTATGAFGYDVASGLIDDDVFSITLDALDRKYVGTGSGLTIIDGTDFTSFMPSDGIGNGAIRDGSLDSAGHIWFATSNGLVEYQDDCASAQFVQYTSQDGLIGRPEVTDYQRYYILGGPIPSGACEKALVSVTVNGRQLGSGYAVDPTIPWIIFDEPLTASDKVEVLVQESWRKVYDLDQDVRNPDTLAAVDAETSRFYLYQMRFPAGEVVLGGNDATGQANSADSMYAIFATPLPGQTGPVVGAITSPAGAVSGTGAAKGMSLYSDVSNDVSLLPSELVGAEFIRLPSTDYGDATDGYLDFTLLAGATVFVAFDARATSLPNWLRDFTPVKSTFRVTDMETFTDASGVEKLFVSVSGTNGCVYSVLQDPAVCDISATIPLDATGPVGCATITSVNSLSNVTLSLTATDAVTGVADMQVSSRSDFTTDGTTAVPFVPFQANYNLELDPASSTTVTSVVTIDPAVVGSPKFLFSYNGSILVATSNPGAVYKFDSSANQLTLLFNTGEQEVTSLAAFGSLLIVGTGVNGKAFSWNGTTLSQLSVAGGERVTALIVFSNMLFIGCSPNGDIFQMDSSGNVTLFKHTFETGITGFAIFGNQLYWSSFNDSVSPGDVLGTVTRQGHRHSVTAQGGDSKISDVNGATSVVDGHSHDVVGGVLQPASTATIPLHTHALNGSASGKVFVYDVGTGQVLIRQSDMDYDVTAVASTSLDATGLLFAGTFPNGKILRYVPQESLFIKSFDTAADSIMELRAIGGSMYAIADNNLFLFDGVRWQFVSAAATNILDAIAAAQGVYVLTSTGISISTGQPPSSDPAVLGDQSICAWVRFRDGAGNVTSIIDDTGAFIQCYNPCVKLSDVLGGTTGSGGGTGSGATTGTNLTQAHRLLEIDRDTNIVFSKNGVEPFLSGNKVEKEVGIYLSEVFNGTNNLVQWVSLSWQGITPPGTSITIAVRTADTQADLATAPWGDEFLDPTSNDLTNQVGQFLQFRATLTVSSAGQPSPELDKVDIQLRMSQATHYFTTNFSLPDKLLKGILVTNSCINPPVTDIVFGITGLNSTDFGDYLVITPGKLFDLPDLHQTKNLRIGIKLISSPTSVPIVDEFALLFEMANDAIVRLNLPGTPGSTNGPFVPSGATRTVTTDQVQGHVHVISFDSTITDVNGVSGQTSVNAGHSHLIVNGVVQISAGHTHEFSV